MLGSEDGVAPLREALDALISLSQRDPEAVDLGAVLADPALALVVFHALDEPDLVKGMRALGPETPVFISASAVNDQIRADPRLVFELKSEISPDQLPVLFTRALGGAPPERPELSADDVALHKRVLELASRFASSRDPAQAARSVSAELCELLDANRVHCLYHDGASGALWALSPVEREHRATRGLAGFAARTGKGLWLRRADEDPRYLAAIDDPGGRGEEQLLVAPICGAEGSVHVVLVVVRQGHREAFDARERGSLGLFIQRAGPLVEHLAQRQELAELVREHEERERGPFRVEALRARQAGERPGEVIRVTGAWVPVSYWLVLALVLVGFAYLAFGRINIYSAGPAVIHLHERRQITARSSGALAEILVEPGERVDAGQLLARLDDRVARSELTRAELSFRAELRARLLEPDDPVTAANLTDLRRQRDNAEAALVERELRAPVAGTVGDLRIRPGQHLSVGETLLSLLIDEDARRVIALLPGSDRPQLRPGMVMRLELPGYQRAYQHLHVRHVGEEVVGPSEARRFLGPTQADALALDGPMVLVEAELDEPSFVVDDQRYDYHEGMLALAEVRVRSESLLEMLFPALRGVLPRG
ncbi:efflux RND transporter periplasmic adaptor subunit [Enhygromyxa salina]|uniref:efflux RND transporter periplasmic adaptor subunit n=1 Tax=Enhygromyxa salina TaxID=215803 RepID=UPI0015E62685|nr:HlyD family efflux transporter periplasmic adaptor subunit [Enhygromyxa salina]